MLPAIKISEFTEEYSIKRVKIEVSGEPIDCLQYNEAVDKKKYKI